MNTAEELFLEKFGNKITASESWVIRFAEEYAKLKLDSLIDVSSRLNQMKEKGYHLRFSGSMQMTTGWLKCDCCGRKTKVKTGYEADYPKNPDMGLCSMCMDELFDLYNKPNV